MKHPTLKIEKTEPACISWGDYGSPSPDLGDYRWKTPAEYRVTGPSGETYKVAGSAAGWMGRSEWYYEGLSGRFYRSEPTVTKGGFPTRAACLDAIAKLEQAAAENAFTGEQS